MRITANSASKVAYYVRSLVRIIVMIEVAVVLAVCTVVAFSIVSALVILSSGSVHEIVLGSSLTTALGFISIALSLLIVWLMRIIWPSRGPRLMLYVASLLVLDGGIVVQVFWPLWLIYWFGLG